MLRSKYNIPDAIRDETLMAIQHFAGLGGAQVYLKELMDSGSYDKAQEVYDNWLRDKNDGKLFINDTIFEYLTKFDNSLKKILKK